MSQNEHKEDIGHVYRNRFADHESQLDDQSWDSIQNRLAKENSKPNSIGGNGKFIFGLATGIILTCTIIALFQYKGRNHFNGTSSLAVGSIDTSKNITAYHKKSSADWVGTNPNNTASESFNSPKQNARRIIKKKGGNDYFIRNSTQKTESVVFEKQSSLIGLNALKNDSKNSKLAQVKLKTGIGSIESNAVKNFDENNESVAINNSVNIEPLDNHSSIATENATPVTIEKSNSQLHNELALSQKQVSISKGKGKSEPNGYKIAVNGQFKPSKSKSSPVYPKNIGSKSLNDEDSKSSQIIPANSITGHLVDNENRVPDKQVNHQNMEIHSNEFDQTKLEGKEDSNQNSNTQISPSGTIDLIPNLNQINTNENIEDSDKLNRLESTTEANKLTALTSQKQHKTTNDQSSQIYSEENDFDSNPKKYSETTLSSSVTASNEVTNSTMAQIKGEQFNREPHSANLAKDENEEVLPMDSSLDDIEPKLYSKDTSTHTSAALQATLTIADSDQLVIDTMQQALSKEDETLNRPITPTKKTSPKNLNHKFIMGLVLSPETSFRRLVGTANYANVVTERNANEKSKIGYAVGLTVQYKLDQLVSLGTGLYGMNVGERGNYYKDSTYSERIDYINNYNYLGIPIMVGLQIGKGPLFARIQSGLLTNILLSCNSTNAGDSYYNHDVNNEDGDNQDEDTQNNPRPNYSRFNLVYMGSVDLNYRLNKQLALQMGPTVKYFLTSIYNKSEGQKSTPYSFGLQFGINYTF